MSIHQQIIDRDGQPDAAGVLDPLSRHLAEQAAGARAVAEQELESMAAAMAPAPAPGNVPG